MLDARLIYGVPRPTTTATRIGALPIAHERSGLSCQVLLAMAIEEGVVPDDLAALTSFMARGSSHTCPG